MLKIRLQRVGKRGQAYFQVVVTEHTSRPQGKYLELLGSYDPHKNELVVDGDKIKHWISKGAKLSETANNLFVGRKIIEGEKVTVWKPKKKKGGASAETPQPALAAKVAPKSEVEAKPEEEIKPDEPETKKEEDTQDQIIS
ncbi:MAG TPA: 30S ribosomal protein S16 [Candidatus Paceibacterota bacterium]